MQYNMLGVLGLPYGAEWIIILLVAILIFGNRIPKIARSIGQSFVEFRRGTKEMSDIKEDIKKDINDVTK
jgi:sec-independent protein translocase protein TatA